MICFQGRGMISRKLLNWETLKIRLGQLDVKYDKNDLGRYEEIVNVTAKAARTRDADRTKPSIFFITFVCVQLKNPFEQP